MCDYIFFMASLTFYNNNIVGIFSYFSLLFYFEYIHSSFFSCTISAIRPRWIVKTCWEWCTEANCYAHVSLTNYVGVLILNFGHFLCHDRSIFRVLLIICATFSISRTSLLLNYSHFTCLQSTKFQPHAHATDTRHELAFDAGHEHRL